MRLASFNLMHGESLSDGRVDAARLRDAVAMLDPDVLALQEVDRGQPRSHGYDLTAIAAEAMHARDWCFVPTLMGTPGGRWQRVAGDGPVEGPAYGVALASRLPVRGWHVERLAAAPVRSPVAVPGRRPRAVLLPDEPRAAVTALLDALTVTSTHLSFVPGWNVLQLVRLARALRRLRAPSVLLGDLNVPAWVPSLATGWRALARGVPTFPAPEPRLQIDHALVRGRLPAVVSARAVQLPLSDHRALVVDLAKPGQPDVARW